MQEAIYSSGLERADMLVYSIHNIISFVKGKSGPLVSD
jgi:hypothetical protein